MAVSTTDHLFILRQRQIAKEADKCFLQLSTKDNPRVDLVASSVLNGWVKNEFVAELKDDEAIIWSS